MIQNRKQQTQQQCSSGASKTGYQSNGTLLQICGLSAGLATQPHKNQIAYVSKGTDPNTVKWKTIKNECLEMLLFGSKFPRKHKDNRRDIAVIIIT
jgi:hypothetical protein